MALAVEAPDHKTVSFRTNDDKTFGARWLKSDYETGVVVDSATVTLRFDPPAGVRVDPRIVEPPDEIRIDSTTPDDPDGWIDATLFADGWVLATVPHTVWADHAGRAGRFDIIAVGEGRQRCLRAAEFVTEEGVS